MTATNPYIDNGIGAGARARIWDSFNDDFTAGLSKDLAHAKAVDVFMKNGGDVIFKNIVSDTFKDHFEVLWNEIESLNNIVIEDTEEIVPNLIPRAELYINNHMNVLLIGPHGTGKTESLQTLVKEMGIKMKYFSCSTLDPYTDLVGVPVPTMNEDGTQNLVMVRDHSIDSAELIFFDEFNRADSQTMNAVFEIIQFGTINGEKLPNLKACWAAMNPPDGDYTVSETDPALLDRFDAYIKMEPAPSVAYMKQHMSPLVAKALCHWWKQHEIKQKNANLKKERMSYCSPRRLFKLGLTWELTHSHSAIEACLPPNGDWDTNKLYDMLDKASGLKDAEGAEGIKALGFNLEKSFIAANFDVIGTAIKDEVVQQQAVIQCLFKGSGPETIFTKYDGFINQYCTAAAVESVINSLPPTKRSNIKSEYIAQVAVNDSVRNSLIARVLLSD